MHSKAFEVPAHYTFVVTVTGFMADDESAALEYCANPSSTNAVWVPYSPNGEPVVFSTTRNPLTLSTPGRYRVVYGETTPDLRVWVSAEISPAYPKVVV